ncbi:helix-turn-helix domain-containing protein [Amycolatopsis thermoflava]|uniref:helix-turn-helix domain-containing protein n=1 Tax=Amycolatopsis thermoflava TaxID=84480 RepID=UPI003668A272
MPDDQAADQPSDFTRKVAANVRAAREAKGWSQERLARKARVHWTTISKLERGIFNPTLIMLARLAQALDAPLADLTRDLPDPPPAPDPYAAE